MQESKDREELLKRIVQLEKELQAQNGQLVFSNTVIGSAKVLIVATDSQNNIQVFNDFAQSLTGYSYEEMQQPNWLERLIPSSEYPLLWSNLFSNSSYKSQQQLELPIRTKQNEEYIISWSNCGIYSNGNEYIGNVYIGTDVTGQRRAEKILKEQKYQISLQNEELKTINIKLKEAKSKAEENEKKYKQAKDEWQSIFEAVGHATLILDLDNTILAANEAAARATGLSQRELVGLSCYQVFHNTFCYCSPAGCPHSVSSTTGHFETAEMLMEALGKTYLVSCTPVYNDANQLKYIIHIATDISERQKAEKALKENEQLLDEAQKVASFGHYKLDVKNGQWVSSSGLDIIFEMQERTLKNIDSWMSLVHPDDKDMMLTHLTDHVFAQRNMFDKEYRIITPQSNTIKWVHGLGSLSFDEQDNPSFMFGTIQDITSRKVIELELIEHKRQLETQNIILLELNQKLLKAKEKAEESDKLKSAFLANMSHEIRTPMNGIIGFTSLLNEPSVSDEKRKRYTTIIRDSCTQLLTIVNDILDISKIETGQIDLNITTCDINDIMSELYSFFKPQAQANNFSLFIEKMAEDTVVMIKSDEAKIKQIMNNLLSNACKFTHEGHVRFGYRKQETDLLFFVEDTGIGIPGADQTIIFDRFKQARHNKHRLYGGTGLGLSIAKAYVEKLGGKIWFTSEHQKGTSFFFTLPL